MKKMVKTAAIMAAMATMAMGMTVIASADEAGWKENTDGTFNWIKEDGSKQKGWFQNPNTGLWYFFDTNGVMKEDEVFEATTGLYYAGKDGAIVFGWAELDSDADYDYIETVDEGIYGESYWMYFDVSTGAAQQKGWMQSPYTGLWFSFTDYVMNEETYVDKDGYMLNEKASDAYDYYSNSNENALIDKDTLSTTTGTVSGVINEDGKSKTYYVDENGYMCTGWFTLKSTKEYGPSRAGSDFWAYSNASGEVMTAVSAWKKIDGDWYYFARAEKDKDTEDFFVRLATDTFAFDGKSENGKDMYFLDDKGVMANGIVTIAKNKELAVWAQTGQASGASYDIADYTVAELKLTSAQTFNFKNGVAAQGFEGDYYYVKAKNIDTNEIGDNDDPDMLTKYSFSSSKYEPVSAYTSSTTVTGDSYVVDGGFDLRDPRDIGDGNRLEHGDYVLGARVKKAWVDDSTDKDSATYMLDDDGSLVKNTIIRINTYRTTSAVGGVGKFVYFDNQGKAYTDDTSYRTVNADLTNAEGASLLGQAYGKTTTTGNNKDYVLRYVTISGKRYYVVSEDHLLAGNNDNVLTLTDDIKEATVFNAR